MKLKQLLKLASKTGLFRLISLKHDFPSVFHKLLNPGDEDRTGNRISMGKNYFPYFLSKMKLDLKSTTIFLKPKGKEAVNIDNLNN